jgi:mannose-1-phosphate guanylyltransferase
VIAIILVGGEGTRLRPLTIDRPKPMLPINGRPFLAHMLDRIAAAGVTEVVFSCGYLPDAIVAAFGDRHGSLDLSYALEPAPLDTAGAIRFAAEGRVDGPFLALNGDVLATAPLQGLIDRHRAAGARATITLTAVADPSRYGLVTCAEDGAVEAFLEKPRPDALPPGPGPYWINAGAYLLDTWFLDAVPYGVRRNIERDVFPNLVGKGLHAWRSDGYWNDIGTPETYLAANMHLSGGASVLADGVQVHDGAIIEGSVILERAAIGPGATVRDSVVGPDAVIGAGAVVEGGCIVGPGVAVPPRSHHSGGRLTAGDAA